MKQIKTHVIQFIFHNSFEHSDDNILSFLTKILCFFNYIT